MPKKGRPRVDPDEKRVVLLAFRADTALAKDIKAFAEYHGLRVPDITRHWWKRAIEKNPAFRVTEKSAG